MSTHAVLGVKMPDNKIIACYVHYDGDSMRPRIEAYLRNKTTTDLTILIAKAQSRGGMRGFNYDNEPPLPESTEFLDDDEEYIVDETNWKEDHFGARYRYLVDYTTSNIEKRSN